MRNYSIEDVLTKQVEYRKGAKAVAKLVGVKRYTIQKHFSQMKLEYKVYNDQWLVKAIEIKK